MGGWGSGRWDRDEKKDTVEDCWEIDVNQLAKKGSLNVGITDVLSWKDPGTGKRLSSVGFSTYLSAGGDRIFQLSYDWDHSEHILIPIQLQTTPMHFGGVRWWFTCPLIVDGNPCNRRVAKLYLSRDSMYYGCRRCHNLTYRSCQEAHQLERLLAPGQVEKMMARLNRLKAKHGWKTQVDKQSPVCRDVC